MYLQKAPFIQCSGLGLHKALEKIALFPLQSLNDRFLQFAGYGTRQPETQLDGKNFTKLCKDCGIIDKKFTTTDSDIIFSKASTPSLTNVPVSPCRLWPGLCPSVQVKAKAARKLTFTEFKRALEDIAVKKVSSAPQSWCLIMCPQPVVLQGLNTTDIEEAIVNSGGPKSQATKADYVKFHDDKSTYTGTYARRVALSARISTPAGSCHACMTMAVHCAGEAQQMSTAKRTCRRSQTGPLQITEAFRQQMRPPSTGPIEIAGPP